MESPWQDEAARMVKDQIEKRGILEPRLLEAMRKVPRHRFVPVVDRDLAYSDGPLPIGFGQTISQPYIVALMSSLLVLEGDECVLEVGTGSGYQAAVLAHLSKWVFSIERHPELSDRARVTISELGLKNITILAGDGTEGLPESSPFDAIMVTAAAPYPPEPLLNQLSGKGRLVLPVGGRGHQQLEVWQATEKGFSHETIIPVAFVPLRGNHGWQNEDWPEQKP